MKLYRTSRKVSGTSNAHPDKHRLAYDVLLDRIARGEYGPGYRLTIEEIARDLHISPTPVREAIRRLEAEGLVVFNRHSGARVAPIDDRTYTEALSVLAVLEGYATALAARRLTPAELAALGEQHAAMRQAVTELDFERFNGANRRFHRTIYLACGNRLLIEILEKTCTRLDMVRRNIFAVIPNRAPKSVEEHEILLQLLRDGAPPTRIEDVARQHALNTLEAYLAWRARRRDGDLLPSRDDAGPGAGTVAGTVR